MKLGMMPLWTKDGQKHVTTLLQVRNSSYNSSVCVPRSVCANLNGQHLCPELFSCMVKNRLMLSINAIKELYF